MSLREYTPDDLRHGRFLRHFMGLEASASFEDTQEILALPADAVTRPKTRETVRPKCIQPTAH